MREEPDEQLLAAVAGEHPGRARAALEVLYDRHAETVMSLARRLTRDDTQAEDVLQDVLVAAARHAGAFRGGSARGWLLTIAGNRSLELLRQTGRRRQRERAAAVPEAREPRDAVAAADELAVHLSRLPARRRLAVELRLRSGLSFADIAGALGVSLRTAKTWVAEALGMLRQHGGHTDG